MANPKDSEWYATRQAQRRRKLVSLTLSDEARQKLEDLSEAAGENNSRIVERLILAAWLRVQKAAKTP